MLFSFYYIKSRTIDKHAKNVFDDFPKISDHFSKIFEDPFEHFPKITDDFRGRSEDVSMIQ